jgi:hypothetical protein
LSLLPATFFLFCNCCCSFSPLLLSSFIWLRYYLFFHFN